MAGDFYSIALVCISGYFLLTAVSNVLYLRGATKAPRAESGPFVSVIVPARNEEGCIARCLDSLLAQRYKGYEVIVVDDESSDATADIVSGFAARDSRVHLVSGKLLSREMAGQASCALSGSGSRARRGAAPHRCRHRAPAVQHLVGRHQPPGARCGLPLRLPASDVWDGATGNFRPLSCGFMVPPREFES